jgi:hypothetical protein
MTPLAQMNIPLKNDIMFSKSIWHDNAVALKDMFIQRQLADMYQDIESALNWTQIL